MSRRHFIAFAGVTVVVTGAVTMLAVRDDLRMGALPKSSRRAAGPEQGKTFFRDVTCQTGIAFHHITESPGTYFFPEIVASGCALLDYDADGDLDVYLVNLGTGYSDDNASPEHNSATNRLYEQVAPLEFRDVTERSGLGDRGYGMGAAVGDINNDGRADVYVTNYGQDRLFLNQGDGTFTDITDAAGIDNPMWGTSATFLDFDQDGWLDLFVTNYVDYFPMDCVHLSGTQQDYCAPQVFPGTADRLFRNVTADGLAESSTRAAGNQPAICFRDVSVTAGISQTAGPGLGVAVCDFTDDGRPDIYVANDQTANVLWVNRGDGTFVDEAVLRGVAYDWMGRPQAGMGTALGDLNGDGRMDLFITHFEGEHNALYSRSGDVFSFSDQALSIGLGQPGFPYTGFGTAMLDLELDGDLDVVNVNGRVKRSESPRSLAASPPSTDSSAEAFWISYAERNQIFLNNGAGQFAEFHSSADSFTAASLVSRGLASGDVDNDGDVDLLVSNTGGPAQLFMNVVPRNGHWLRIAVCDEALGGRDVYGAAVTVVADRRRQVRLVNPGLSYLSSSDPRVHFGLGAATEFEQIEVRWPDGVVESFPAGPADREIRLVRGTGRVHE